WGWCTGACWRAVDPGGGLGAGPAVRLLDLQFRVRLFEILRDEHGVEVTPQFACRVIRHIEQFERLGLTIPTRDLGILRLTPNGIDFLVQLSARMVAHIQEGRVFLRCSHWHDADTDHEDQKDTYWYFAAHEFFHVDMLYTSAPCHQHLSSVV